MNFGGMIAYYFLCQPGSAVFMTTLCLNSAVYDVAFKSRVLCQGARLHEQREPMSGFSVPVVRVRPELREHSQSKQIGFFSQAWNQRPLEEQRYPVVWMFPTWYDPAFLHPGALKGDSFLAGLTVWPKSCWILPTMTSVPF